MDTPPTQAPFVPQPLRFRPIFRPTLWGGRNLATLLQKDLPPDRCIGESWEISDREGAVTPLISPDYSNTDLRLLLSSYPQPIYGTSVSPPTRFPLLVKFLDAALPLSVQLHPTERYASTHPLAEPKTEFWYVLFSPPRAQLILGLKPDTDETALRKAVAAGDPTPYLRYVDIVPGSHFLIPPGILHSLLPGTVLLEIQQDSDTTLRLYDWHRLDHNGQPRPLHIQEALDALDFPANLHPPLAQTGRPFTSPEASSGPLVKQPLLRHPLFDVDLCVGAAGTLNPVSPPPPRLTVLACTNGAGVLYYDRLGSLAQEPLGLGDVLLLPAALRAVELTAQGPLTALTATYPGSGI